MQQQHTRQPGQDRLRFIEFRAFWDGRVNRRDLMEAFGISDPQASLDLRRYTERYPHALRYDASAKTYLPSTEFQPALLTGDLAEDYLIQLHTLELAAGAGDPTWLAYAPQAELLPRSRKPVNAYVLRNVLSAIRQRQRIQIQYQSGTSDGAEERWIAPHALAYNGYRWHARAWCPKRRDFRDFVLSRMQKTGELVQHDIDPQYDMEWNTYVTLNIAPHPKLDPRQRRAVVLDYNMSAGMVNITTRACLYHYLEWNLRLDQPEAPEPRWKMEVVLRNRVQVEERCRLAKEQAQQLVMKHVES